MLRALEFAILGLILGAVTSAHADGYRKFNADWLACKSKKDCVIATGACSEPVCVARKHQKEAQEYYNAAAADVRCMAPQSKPRLPKIQCVKNECHCG